MKASLLIFPLFFSPFVFATAPHWEYGGEAGPEHWAQLTPEFSQCSGSNQSPINLTGLIKANLIPLSFHYLVGGESVQNNGHTIQVNYAPGSTLLLDGINFELKQFHFHAPSENLIEGKSYPLEGHMVHVGQNGEIVVVAVMFKAGRTNEVLTEAWHSLPSRAGESLLLKQPLAAEQLLPIDRHYYRFSGSLTTPPCSEGVRWLVMKEPVEASQAQIDAFKAVIHHPNNRPVQALNGRMVLE
ncbi:UNVERIFIED_CONTAM: carbonic anhydrase family protein [Aeromonas hydrophila]